MYGMKFNNKIDIVMMIFVVAYWKKVQGKMQKIGGIVMKIFLKWSDIKVKALKITPSRINCSLSSAHCSYFAH